MKNMLPAELQNNYSILVLYVFYKCIKLNSLEKNVINLMTYLYPWRKVDMI